MEGLRALAWGAVGSPEGELLASAGTVQKNLKDANARLMFLTLADLLDIHQDGAGVTIEGEIVEQVAEVDIDRVADRGNCGEADPAMRRPFDRPGGDGARLRNQGERAGGRHPVGEAGIKMRAGHDQAEAVRSEHAQAVGAGSGTHRLRKGAGAMAKAGADHDGRSHPWLRRQRRFQAPPEQGL
jgi:hypothetical protein